MKHLKYLSSKLYFHVKSVSFGSKVFTIKYFKLTWLDFALVNCPFPMWPVFMGNGRQLKSSRVLAWNHCACHPRCSRLNSSGVYSAGAQADFLERRTEAVCASWSHCAAWLPTVTASTDDMHSEQAYSSNKPQHWNWTAVIFLWKPLILFSHFER